VLGGMQAKSGLSPFFAQNGVNVCDAAADNYKELKLFLKNNF
jgi:hypothetical protein